MINVSRAEWDAMPYPEVEDVANRYEINADQYQHRRLAQ